MGDTKAPLGTDGESLPASFPRTFPYKPRGNAPFLWKARGKKGKARTLRGKWHERRKEDGWTDEVDRSREMAGGKRRDERDTARRR